MKKYSIALLVFCSLFFLATAFPSLRAVAASAGAAHFHTRQETIPSKPFSGIVQGTVLATSTTSITIDEKTYRGKNATSTERTFGMATDVRINADQSEYATSSMSDISIGSSVSLVIERVGTDAGKVSEIRLQPIL